MKAPVSVVVITKNEAGRITDCLKSVDWASEIIVLDDCSSDDTVRIAESFKARVFSREMQNEGKHRNYAYSLATQDWVLSLDADERVTPELRDEIVELVKTNPNCNGYAIPRKNHVGTYWARWGGMYPSAQLRLFRKGVFKYDELAEVHPQAYMKDPRGTLQGDIMHYTYRDFTDAIAKLDRQTDLEARKWFREQRKVGVLGILRRMVDRFIKQYFTRKGYKDGVVGLFLAVSGSMYQFLSFVKYWEMKKRDADPRR